MEIPTICATCECSELVEADNLSVVIGTVAFDYICSNCGADNYIVATYQLGNDECDECGGVTVKDLETIAPYEGGLGVECTCNSCHDSFTEPIRLHFDDDESESYYNSDRELEYQQLYQELAEESLYDYRGDEIALDEDWANWTDMLCKDGVIYPFEYENWSRT